MREGQKKTRKGDNQLLSTRRFKRGGKDEGQKKEKLELGRWRKLGSSPDCYSKGRIKRRDEKSGQFILSHAKYKEVLKPEKK